MRRELVATWWTPGVPIPQGSKKMMPAGRRIPVGAIRTLSAGPYWLCKGGQYVQRCVMIEDAKDLRRWRGTLTAHARVHWSGRDSLDGVLALGAQFCFVRPDSHFTTKARTRLRKGIAEGMPRKPDLGKLIRAVEDSLTVAAVWLDDAQVDRYVDPRKQYGRDPGVQIAVYRLATDDLFSSSLLDSIGIDFD